MELLDISVTSAKGNRYVMVMVDSLDRRRPAHYQIKQLYRSRTLSSVTLYENKVMHELCILGGAHKTKTTPYHPESDGLVKRFNRTLLMMQCRRMYN